MELFAKRSTRKIAKVKNPMKNTSIFEDLARHYAQQNPPQEDGGQVNPQDETGADPEQTNPGVDTDSLAQGQTIYDLAGIAYTVLEPTQDGKKQIMPADQQGQQVPKGIKQVEDNDLASAYTMSPQASRKMAQDFGNACSNASDHIEDAVRELEPFANQSSSELDTSFANGYLDPLTELAGFLKLERMVSERMGKVSQSDLSMNWNDFDDILNSMKFAIDNKDAKSLMEAAEDMVDLILMNVSVPVDTDISLGIPKEKVAEVLPAFRKAQMGDINSFHEPQTFSSGKDDESGLTVGEGGFGDCMTRLKELLSGGYEVVDIILTLGEEYPRELANKVLSEAREKGIL